MENNTPTAEDFYFHLTDFELPNHYVRQAMIEFAKLHVTQALKAASEKAKTNVISEYEVIVDKSTILNSYPLTLIK